MSDTSVPLPTTAGEEQLLAAYDILATTLREHRDDLSPFAERNAIKALAALWQVANGLGREPGQVYDLGA